MQPTWPHTMRRCRTIFPIALSSTCGLLWPAVTNTWTARRLETCEGSDKAGGARCDACSAGAATDASGHCVVALHAGAMRGTPVTAGRTGGFSRYAREIGRWRHYDVRCDGLARGERRVVVSETGNRVKACHESMASSL